MILTDFEPLQYSFPENAGLTVYPISDLHIGAEEAQLEKWEAFKKKLLNEPRSYLTLSGDLLNNSTKNSVGNAYAEKMRPREQKRYLIEQLSDIKDKILCIVPGNHEYRSDKEVDCSPLYDVACALGIEDKFRENAAFVFIRLGPTSHGWNNPFYSICVLHGSGGGVYTGATVNRNERFAYTMDGLDVLIVGHSHKGVVSKPQKIVIDPRNKKVSFRNVVVVSASAWTQYGGYALRKQLLPAGHSLHHIQLCGDKKDIRVIVD